MRCGQANRAKRVDPEPLLGPAGRPHGLAIDAQFDAVVRESVRQCHERLAGVGLRGDRQFPEGVPPPASLLLEQDHSIARDPRAFLGKR